MLYKLFCRRRFGGSLFLYFFCSSAFTQSFSKDPLKLTVRRAELVGSPSFNGIHRLDINAEYKTFYRILPI